MGTEQDLNRQAGSVGAYSDGRDSGAIKRDIDRTRSRMDETIDALTERLQPRNLVHEALGWAGYETQRSPSPNDTVNAVLKSVAFDLLHSFRDSAKDAGKAGAKKAGAAAWQVARCHPLPTAMIGAGVAWLLYDSSCGLADKARAKGWKVHNPDPQYGGSYVDARTGEPYRASYGSESRGRHAPAATARPTPEPTHGGSYVDARTGQPYNPSTYQQEARSMQNESHETNPGACPPGYTPSRGADTGSSGASDRGITDRARDTVSGAAGSVREGIHSAGDTVRGGIHTAGDAARSGAHYASDSARHAAESARHAAERAAHAARERARHAAHTLSESASSTAHYLSESSRSAAHQVRSGLDYSRERAWYAVENYPLAVGAAALGVGLLLGLTLPRTRKEEEVLGEQARHLRERAREAGQEAIERGRRAARETVHAVTEEAERQGLSASGVRGSVRDFASRVVHDVRDEAKESGLTVGAVKEKARHIAEHAQETARQEIRGGDSKDDRDDESTGGNPA